MIHYFIIIFCGLATGNAHAALPVKATMPKAENEKPNKTPAQMQQPNIAKPKEKENTDKNSPWGAPVKAQIQHQQGYFD